jgi:hypothetical protein
MLIENIHNVNFEHINQDFPICSTHFLAASRSAKKQHIYGPKRFEVKGTQDSAVLPHYWSQIGGEKTNTYFKLQMYFSPKP